MNSAFVPQSFHHQLPLNLATDHLSLVADNTRLRAELIHANRLNCILENVARSLRRGYMALQMMVARGESVSLRRAAAEADVEIGVWLEHYDRLHAATEMPGPDTTTSTPSTVATRQSSHESRAEEVSLVIDEEAGSDGNDSVSEIPPLKREAEEEEIDVDDSGVRVPQQPPTRRRRHDDDDGKCFWPGCSFVTDGQTSLDDHIRVHIKPKWASSRAQQLFMCNWPQCVQSFRVESSLVRHKRFHVRDAMLRCEICDTRFLSPEYLDSHRQTHVTQSEANLKCPKENCGMRFADPSHYCAHLDIHRRDDMGLITFACVWPTCPFDTCNARTLANHIRTHFERPSSHRSSSSTPEDDDLAGDDDEHPRGHETRQEVRKNDLASHSGLMANQSNECCVDLVVSRRDDVADGGGGGVEEADDDDADAEDDDSGSFRDRAGTGGGGSGHDGDDSYDSRDSRDELKRTRYSGAGRYRCPWPGCNYTPHFLRDLRRHVHKHTGERRYRCTCRGCDFTSVWKTSLLQHVRKLHKDGELNDGLSSDA